MSAKVTTIGRLKRRKRVLAVLEAKLKELLRSSAEREELEIENLADPLDQVRSVVDRDIAVRSLTQKSQLIQEVRSAIDKVQSETFGICEESEAAISPQRLDAIPWARLCVKCQNRSEERRVGKECRSRW